ncbi:MAG: type II toxin-antitoxin system death-on-curing family toxin [Geminicoccaceae bacterium]
MTWRWLSRRAALAIHAEQIAEHGGAPGVRDEELLDSALARPRQRAACSEPDTADLAAAYAFGIVRNHPFVDGNKRTGFVVAATFVLLNGCEMDAWERDIATTFGRLADGALSEEQLADWFRRNSFFA